MKRFITVSAADAQEVLILIRNAAIGAATADAYQWLKQQLARKNVAHNDQQAQHHNQLPHQGGYSSFYLEQGQWMRQNH